MNVLIWCCPWGSQGQPLFFQGSLGGILVPQANALADQGAYVTLALPDYLLAGMPKLNEKISVVTIDSNKADFVVGTSDPLPDLHDNPLRYERQLCDFFREVLPSNVDVVLTWENPVSYLRCLYPEALIFSQMPGCFSRSPFPHMITLDPRGLYDQSILSNGGDLLSRLSLSQREREFERQFSGLVRERINLLQPFNLRALGVEEYETSLLPLQVSAHYAFRGQSNFRSQADFLAHVLSSRSESERVLVTQYKSSFTSEAPINAANYEVLKKRWPQLVWDPSFDLVPSPSQFLLGISDKVISHSSSILFQAMAWGKGFEPVSSSYYSQFNATSIDDVERNRRVMAFILSRYNLSVVNIRSGEFMISLLEEALHKRNSAKSHVDILPYFSDIDADYEAKLIESFNHEKILRDVTRTNASVGPRVKLVSDFERKIRRSSIKVVSFDIFDTLIARPFERPSDLFKLLRYQAEVALKRRLRDFADIRMWSEKTARTKLGAHEATLEQIYQGVQSHYNLSDADTSFLRELEIEIECKCIRPRVIGQDMYRIAQKSGKRIILISDMYLPKSAVEKLLSKCGIDGGYTLFLSSENGSTKASTTLFSEALNVLNVRADEMVHVGDNPKNDIAMAKKVGIQPFHVRNSFVRFHSNKLYSALFPSKPSNEFAKSLVAGMVTNKLFDGYAVETEEDSLFQGEAWRLGYAGLGPFLAGFAQWLHRSALRDGRTKLYFLSREGFVLQQIYNAMWGDEALPTEYLYCSRRAARVADLRCADDVADLAYEAYAKGTRFHSLLKSRFGLEDEDLIKLDGHLYDRELETSVEGRAEFVRLVRVLADTILEKTKSERSAYLAYLNSVGFMDESYPAVIDLGWKGNMQAALMRLREAPINGYYVATLAGVEASGVDGSLVDGFMGNRIGAMASDPVIQHRKIVELLLCHTEPSLERFRLVAGNPVPVFLQEDRRHQRARFIGEVHRGAVMFASEYRRSFAGLDDRSLEDYRLTSRVLNAFLSEPTESDASLLADLTFEDNFAGAQSNTVDSFWNGSQSKVVNIQVRLDSQSNGARIIKPFHLIEHAIIKTFWTDQQFGKYVRNSERFFADSRVMLARKWGDVRKRFLQSST